MDRKDDSPGDVLGQYETFKACNKAAYSVVDVFLLALMVTKIEDIIN